jgi:hypothetical protein
MSFQAVATAVGVFLRVVVVVVYLALSVFFFVDPLCIACGRRPATQPSDPVALDASPRDGCCVSARRARGEADLHPRSSGGMGAPC